MLRKDFKEIIENADDGESHWLHRKSFDAILCKNVIFYTDYTKSLPELERVLKNNGVVIVSLDEKIVKLEDNSSLHSANIDEMLKYFSNSKILEKTYHERIDQEPWPHKHFYYDVVVRKSVNEP